MDKKLLDNLIQKIQLGDEKAFEDFYVATNKKLFSFVYIIVRNQFDAQDIVQETFIKFKANVNSYKIGTNPSAFLMQIAKHTALDKLRKAKRETNYNSENFEVSDLGQPCSQKEQSLYIHDLINNNLQLEERQIIILHIVGGYKHREIAKFLGLPLGTVLWKYNRAIKILKEKIREEQKS